MTQASLIKCLQAKDHKAMANLYDSYAPALLGIIMRIVKTETIAKEVLQETCIKIWNKAYQYDETKGAFFTWISRIAKNTALNYIALKSEKKQTLVTELEEKHNHIKIQTPNIDVLDIKGKVNELEEKYKMVIELLYFKGYTQQEISDELNIPLGTIKTRARQAIQKLRVIYTDTITEPNALSIVILSFLITPF